MRYIKPLVLLIIFTAITLIVFLLLPAIPQDINYHNFADQRTLFSINNFLNVISNIAFIIVGCFGVIKVFSATFKTPSERWPYIMLFLGVILVGIGSTYYHLNPNNFTLIWDRLPICIIFMSYFSAILMERVNRKLGLYLLAPLIILGMLSAIQWELSELAGRGDLRFYGLVQVYPFVMIILMILLFPATYTSTHYIALSLGWYILAKLAEYFDNGIYTLTFHIISGHTLKHIAAAFGVYAIILYLSHRKITKQNPHPNT